EPQRRHRIQNRWSAVLFDERADVVDRRDRIGRERLVANREVPVAVPPPVAVGELRRPQPSRGLPPEAPGPASGASVEAPSGPRIPDHVHHARRWERVEDRVRISLDEPELLAPPPL